MKFVPSPATRPKSIAIAAFLMLALLALPASASAKLDLPKPKDSRIDVPNAIGGVELGQTLKNAGKAWGAPDCGRFVCSFGNRFGNSGTAEISDDLRDTIRVDYVDVSAALGHEKGQRKPAFSPKLGRFHTKEGIGLGSRASDVKNAYPSAKKDNESFFSEFVIEGRGKSTMSFGYRRFEGQNLVTSITLSAG